MLDYIPSDVSVCLLVVSLILAVGSIIGLALFAVIALVKECSSDDEC